MPELLRPALDPVLGIIAALTAQIRELDRKIEALAKESYPQARLVAQAAARVFV